MNSVFVPAGEASAVMSQLASSRLDLRRFEGLNGAPDRFYDALLLADALGLSGDPRVQARLGILESYGVASAMTSATSLDRMASVLSNDGNLLWTRPKTPFPSPVGGRSVQTESGQGRGVVGVVVESYNEKAESVSNSQRDAFSSAEKRSGGVTRWGNI